MKLKFDTELSDAQRELFACLAEEAAEVVQAVGKILRHGLYSYGHGSGETNQEVLAREIGDLEYVVKRLIDGRQVDAMSISTAKHEKAAKFLKYTHFQLDSEDWRNS